MRTFSEPLTDGAGSAFFLLHEKNIRLKTAAIIEKIFLHMLLNYLKNASFSSNLPLLKKRRFFSKQRHLPAKASLHLQMQMFRISNLMPVLPV